MRKASIIAFTIKGKPIADRLAQEDRTRPSRLFHERGRGDCGGEGLRSRENEDSSARWYEGWQVRGEMSCFRIVASGIESHIEDDVAGRMRGHFISRGLEEIANSEVVHILDRFELNKQ